MTVRFARHGNKSQVDPTPTQCDEEWVRLQPVAFEVGGLCYCLVQWLEAAILLPPTSSAAGQQVRRCKTAPVLSGGC